MNWRAELDWTRRSAEFGPLTRYQGEPAVVFTPSRVTPAWGELCGWWSAMPRHSSLLQVLSTGNGDGRIVVRYAPISWEKRAVPDETVVQWAAQVSSVFRAVEMVCPPERRWMFMRPDVHVDVGSGLRIGFLPPDGSERSVDLQQTANYVIYELAKSVRNPQLAARLRTETFREGVRTGIAKAAWEQLDVGIGHLLLGDWTAAMPCIEDADFILASDLTRWGINECRAALGMELLEMPAAQQPRVVKPAAIRATAPRSWADLEPLITEREKERDFKGALVLYDEAIRIGEQRAMVLARRARCHLELHETGHAIDYARRSLELERSHSAFVTLVRGWLEHREPAKALAVADGFVGAATHDATAHYLRGKALLALGRLEESRDEFDLAIAFKPTMLEAILLRSEAHRTLVKLGKVVGQQRTVVAIPPSLESLREVLTSGRSKNIIEALSAPSLADDAEAQLMLARFLGFADRHDDAIDIYDRWLDSPHRATALIGKAGALLDLGRIDSALALFDVVVAEQPHNLDACEGRARTLDTLGRTAEAAAEFRRFISLGAQRAEIRVRAAQLWLDAH